MVNTRPPARFAADEMPQELLAAIGEIIVRWGYLHFQLHVTVREVLSLRKDTGRVVLIGPELSVLCNMLRTLTASDHWIKDKGIREEIEQLGKDVRDAS